MSAAPVATAAAARARGVTGSGLSRHGAADATGERHRSCDRTTCRAPWPCPGSARCPRSGTCATADAARPRPSDRSAHRWLQPADRCLLGGPGPTSSHPVPLLTPAGAPNDPEPGSGGLPGLTPAAPRRPRSRGAPGRSPSSVRWWTACDSALSRESCQTGHDQRRYRVVAGQTGPTHSRFDRRISAGGTRSGIALEHRPTTNHRLQAHGQCGVRARSGRPGTPERGSVDHAATRSSGAVTTSSPGTSHTA